jgi:RNA polymerase sigma-70 factor, ECF subfamily
LAEIEVKAYRMARYALGNHHDALDVLQEAMCSLAVKYANLPCEQWKPIFYKILQNAIVDLQRRNKVRRVLFFWQSEENAESDWPADEQHDNAPDEYLCKSRQVETALAALATLADKQRQCFLLRSWEGMSVAQTAEIMGCSEGAVKTHYFRAVTKLRTILGEVHDVQI